MATGASARTDRPGSGGSQEKAAGPAHGFRLFQRGGDAAAPLPNGLGSGTDLNALVGLCASNCGLHPMASGSGIRPDGPSLVQTGAGEPIVCRLQVGVKGGRAERSALDEYGSLLVQSVA